MKIAAIDFETANRNPASVCSVGISSYEDGAVEERYYSLIRPEEDGIRMIRRVKTCGAEGGRRVLF